MIRMPPYDTHMIRHHMIRSHSYEVDLTSVQEA